MKKEWEKPEISILVRGSAEENVLQICKEKGNTRKCYTEKYDPALQIVQS